MVPIISTLIIKNDILSVTIVNRDIYLSRYKYVLLYEGRQADHGEAEGGVTRYMRYRPETGHLPPSIAQRGGDALQQTVPYTNLLNF